MEALFWLGCTIAIYLAAKLLYRKFNKAYLTPLLLTPVIVIAVVRLSGVSYEAYDQGAGLLSDMVEPATIALAVILYRNFNLLKKNVSVILASVGCGALAAIVTSAGLAHLLGLSDEISNSLAPRSSTTPIAVSVSSIIGGVPTITAAATIVTGLIGMMMGPLIVKWFRIKHPVARGLLFGTSAHSAGISKALEYGTVSGSVAGIAMIFTAFVTLCAAPWVMVLFQ